MLDITIQKETASQFEDIYQVNRLAFNQDAEAKLVNSLRRNNNVFVPELSLTALLDGKIVGHILFTKITIVSKDQNTESLALAPMAVLPEFQSKGIGGKLIQKGLTNAKELGFESVIVLGHEHYYPKFGFEPASKWNIKAPFDVPNNAFMAIELTTGALANINGVVQYPNEFNEV